MKTSEFASMTGLKPQSIRVRFQKTGSYYGIIPFKLPNGRLVWPEDSQTRRFQAHISGNVVRASDTYNLYRLFNIISDDCRADVEQWLESKELPMYYRSKRIFSRMQGESRNETVSKSEVQDMCNGQTDIILGELWFVMKKKGRQIPDVIKPRIIY